MSDKPVLTPPTARQIRAELERLVVEDLYGPADGDEHEELPSGERPVDRYILGRLAPNGALIQPEEQDGLADSGVFDSDEPDVDDTGSTDPDAPAAPSMFCSAHGFTVCVEPQTTRLHARASWARYISVDNPDPEKQGKIYRREPHRGETEIPVDRDGEFGPFDLDPDQPGVCVRGRVRTYGGLRLVTVFLVNAQHGDAKSQELWLFQAELSLTAADGVSPVFVPRPESFAGGDRLDIEEQRRLAMTHRFAAEFAVGHSVAVDVETAPGDPMRAVRVRTAAVPGHELPATDVPNAADDPDLPELADLVVDMKALSEMDAVSARTALDPLVTGYRRWIERQRSRIDDPATHLGDYRAEAERNLVDAEVAAERIGQAIDLLENDPRAFAAFRFANRAMYLQRVHSIAAQKRDGDEDQAIDDLVQSLDVPRNRSWRPFQLAFLLLNLPSLTDPAHPERADDNNRVADLLWFPTGGGKTEAYLGLTAYTLAIRRLQGTVGAFRGHSGVAVLMRYTLRLLTIQQFQRAATLICACEVLRRQDEQTWGAVPFRIGLWVGGKVTPNRTDAAADWVKAKRTGRGGNRADGSPHQLMACAWCGSAIDPGTDIDVDTVRQRTLVHCPDLDCPFSSYNSQGEGLPVLVVDQEIYRLVPSLVIATVDKFAQLAWQGETRALFGGVRQVCERHGYLTGELHATVCGDARSHKAEHRGRSHPAASVRPAERLRPPDLIIQDELHLISGPLGSLVGLYETAVDRLATWEYPVPGREMTVNVRPKVIASTATVRRASRQISSLFAGRETRVFPPPGLDAADNFFARQRDPAVRDGRRYVGICAHGVRLRSTQIRLYVAVLAAAQKLHDKYGGNEITDPYMTLVGYFNSLRDLGGVRRVVEDDVATRLGRADERGLARRGRPLVEELTSRLGSEAIPQVLSRLQVPFPKTEDTRHPIDVLLATNMIAVGVDVSRLGVMIVNGQPKSTAEYIQATSRVGRSSPGLVFTVYGWSRPRDLSHYERFGNYHATLYRHVEALSVTPFAARAVDRGLMGLIVSLARNLSDTLNPNLGAGRFDRTGQLADHIVNEIERRAEQVTDNRSEALAVAEQANHRLDVWHQRRNRQGRDGITLAYKPPYKSKDVVGLLTDPGEGRWRPTTCPTSLREVEPGIRLVLNPDHGVGTDNEPPFLPNQEKNE